MKSWTRTLNLDDAHSLLALAEPGQSLAAWTEACHEALPELSVARRRELVRLIREGFLDLTADEHLAKGLFLRMYQETPATAQIDLVAAQWALSHPITLVAVERLVRPAIENGNPEIPFEAVEKLVHATLATESDESLRKTRTTLLGALEEIGAVVTRGTGQHRALRAVRGTPHPAVFGYLVQRELAERGIDAMMANEAVETSLPVRLYCCDQAHAEACVSWNLERGYLEAREDEVGVPRI